MSIEKGDGKRRDSSSSSSCQTFVGTLMDKLGVITIAAFAHDKCIMTNISWP
jgi:hypothetical protein